MFVVGVEEVGRKKGLEVDEVVLLVGLVEELGVFLLGLFELEHWVEVEKN